MKTIFLKQPITLGQIAAWTGAELSPGTEDRIVTSVATDSREVISGSSLFVALRGKVDGHAYLASALEKGAVAVMGDVPFDGAPYLRTKDFLRGFCDLAKGYRSLFSLPILALTGSVGKTTTKEFVASVLSQKYRCLKTEENFNNELGVPLTLLQLAPEHEIAVVELGMNHFGEISRLTRIVQPDAALITTIGTAHQENLGSREGILKAKLEILEGLAPNGTLFLGENDLLDTVCVPYPTVRYGEGEGCDVRGFEIATKDGFASFVCDGLPRRVHLPFEGRHNVANALAAIAVGRHFGVSEEQILNGIEQTQTVGDRMKKQEYCGVTAILDYYNANTESMRAGLNVLRDKNANRRIAILADMLELGENAAQEHFEVGRCASFADALITVGSLSEQINRGAEGVKVNRHFTSNEEACRFLQSFLRKGDTLLIKGSHAMHLEQIREWLEQQKGWEE